MYTKFKNKASRTILIEKITNQLKKTNYELPIESYTALNFLIERLAKGKNERIALTRGNVDLDFHVYHQDSYKIHSRAFMKKTLIIHPKNTLESKVNLALDNSKITLSYLDNNKKVSEEIPLDQFLTASNNSPEIYNQFEGVAIRRHSESVIHNNKRITISNQNNQYVIIVFDKEKEYLFDFKGNMLFKTLGKKAFHKKQCLQNYVRAKTESEELKLDDLVKDVRNELEQRWKKDKESFQAYGRTKIIKGKLQTKTSEKGSLNLTHYEKKNGVYAVKPRLFVSKTKPNTNITVNFKGHCIWIEDSQPLQGIILKNSAFEYSRLRERKIEDYSFIALKENNNISFFNNRARFRIGNYMHYLSVKEYRKLVSQVGNLEQFDRRAFYVSKLEDKFNTEFWFMKGNKFLSIPINASRMEY